MTEPLWVRKQTVLALHGLLIVEFGGLPGIRDEGLLDSALARAENLFGYEKPSIFDLAAAYAGGITRNHPFNDGNKRSAFITATVFLETNGYDFGASEPESAVTMLALAANEMDEAQFSAWLKANSKPRRQEKKYQGFR